MAKVKERNLTHTERYVLNELVKKAQNRRNETADRMLKIDDLSIHALEEVTKAAAQRAGGTHKEYLKQKKALDQWKTNELQRINNEYQKRLGVLRQDLRSAHDAIEKQLNEAKNAILQKAVQDKAGLHEVLEEDLRENQAEQDKIRYIAILEEKDATATGEG